MHWAKKFRILREVHKRRDRLHGRAAPHHWPGLKATSQLTAPRAEQLGPPYRGLSADPTGHSRVVGRPSCWVV